MPPSKDSGAAAANSAEFFSPMGSARSTADGAAAAAANGETAAAAAALPVAPPPSALPAPASLVSPRGVASGDARVPYPTLAAFPPPSSSSEAARSSVTLDGGAGSNPAPAFDDGVERGGAAPSSSSPSAAAVAAAVAAAAASLSVAEGDARATPPLASVPTSEVPGPPLLPRSEKNEEDGEQREAAKKAKRGETPTTGPDGLGRGRLGYRYVRRRRANPVGWALMLLWAASLAYYLYVRLVFTLKGADEVFVSQRDEREENRRQRREKKNSPLSLLLVFDPFSLPQNNRPRQRPPLRHPPPRRRGPGGDHRPGLRHQPPLQPPAREAPYRRGLRLYFFARGSPAAVVRDAQGSAAVPRPRARAVLQGGARDLPADGAGGRGRAAARPLQANRLPVRRRARQGEEGLDPVPGGLDPVRLRLWPGAQEGRDER